MNEATLRKMGERHDYVRRTLALLEAIEAAGEAGVGDETALRVMGAEASGIRGVTGRLAHARWAAEALGRPWPEPWARVKEDGATRWRAGAGTAPARRILESYLARAGEHAHLPLGHPDAGEATAGGPTLVLGAIERCTERVRQAGSFAGARALVVALDRMGGGLWEERTLTGVHIARVEGAEHAIEPWCARGNRLGQLRATGDAWERSHRVGGEDEPAQVRLCRARRVERRVPAGDVGAQMLRAVGQIKLGDNAGWQARRDARPTVYADLGRTRTGGRYGEGEWLRPPEDIAAERVWVVRTLDEAGRERACEATYLRNEVPSAGGLARDGYVAAGETVVAITTRADEDGAPPPARAQRPAAPDWSLRTPLEGGTSLLYLEYRAADLAFVREDATTGEAAAQATAALARAAARHDLRTVLGLDEPERGYFPHLQGLAERGLLEPGDPSEIREGLEEDFALRRGHRRAAKPAPAATHERRHDAPVQDAAMRALAERHQLRWIAERRQGARGPGGGGCWASAIEAELEGLAEVMGAAPRTLGLGRRLALVLGPRGRGQTLVEWNGDTAVAHLTPGAAGGSDLARAWARALRVALDAQASNDERAMLDAFDAALERERPEGEDPQAWVEHTFEAFVEAEGRLRGGGDVAATTRDGAAPEARGPGAERYPAPGETRARTSWLWRTLRAALEWDEDGCRIVGTKDAFERAQAHREAYHERAERAKTELARVSARSVANARAAGLGLAAVAALGAGGASAWLVSTGDETRSGAGARDDGRVPDLSERWVLAQIAEGVAAQARRVLGRGMRTGWVRARRETSGRWRSTGHGWTPAGGVDGAGAPTYGDCATIRIERWGASVTLMAGSAGETLASLGETIAEAAAAQAASDAVAATLEWDIERNTWTTTLEGAPGGASATEIMSGERTGRHEPRRRGAAADDEGPGGPGA